MVNFTVLAGGFTGFIATYLFDSDAGTLALTKQNPTGQNPSWIAPHRLNSSILYAVNEIGPVGNLQSFLIDEEGGLQLVDTVSTGGNGPTFTNPLTTGEVSAMNFGSPNSSFIATDPEDPARFLRDSPVVEFPVNGGPSNPHMSLEFNGEIFIPDLGADKIWRVVNDGEPGRFRVQGQIDVAPGNGPRHIAIRDGVLFTLHEKTSVLTAQPIPEAPNGTTLPLFANVSIVPPEVASINGSFFAAEIVISEPTEAFPDPLIYVSNRNLGPQFDERGDTIAIFEFKALTAGNDPAETASGTTISASDSASTSATATATATSSPSASTAAGPVITLVAANTGPAPAKRDVNPPPVKRMLKYHARRRSFHEQAKRQYGYDTPAPAASSSAADSGAATTPAPTITLVAASGSESAATSTATVPVAPTATPTGGSLELVNQVFTGLRQIRSFAIGKPDDGGDEFLIAGANLDGGVAVFRRTEGGRNLELVARNTELQNRTSFVFL